MRYISALPAKAWSEAACRTVVLLGSTGSIGRSALEVIARYSERFRVAGLAGGNNVSLLHEQILRFKPDVVAVRTEQAAHDLLERLPRDNRPEVLIGQEGYVELASLTHADTVLSAQVGAAGLRSTMAAIKAGKVVCIANKESLVLAGKLIRQACAESGAVVLPVDSEHNAVFQAWLGHDSSQVSRIILTASGGPFRGWSKEKLALVQAEQALKHPNWSMGAKISIDSASLMNKGLEVLEAQALYDISHDQIAVVIHPESVIHSILEFKDGSSLAQMGTPDMRIPIAQCLNWPYCADVGVPVLELAARGSLTFENPDMDAFPCLALAWDVMRGEDGLAIALNAANEVAVQAFLERTIRFADIPLLVRRAMDECPVRGATSVEEILALDQQVRQIVRTWF